MLQLPPFWQTVVMRFLPVANSCPTGQVKLITVPNAVSRLLAIAPMPGFSSGQSAENSADQLIHWRKVRNKIFRKIRL